MKFMDLEEFHQKYYPFGAVLYREISTNKFYKVEFDFNKALILQEVNIYDNKVG